MRGHYVPLAFGPVLAPDDATEEIRSAIDAVRFSADQGAPERLPSECLVVPKAIVVNPIDRVAGSTLVHVRGRVPLAFFPWFKELRSQLEDQQTMPNLCCFEEDE